MDRNFQNAQLKACRSKKQIKIAPALYSSQRHSKVIAFEENFGAAERVADALTNNFAGQKAEAFVANKIRHLHRLPLHRVYQPRAIDEICGAVLQRHQELEQLFRSDCHVRIQNHQDIAVCRKSCSSSW